MEINPKSQQIIPYFTRSELACQGTGELKLSTVLKITLPYLRYKWGKPLIVTSGCRSPEHNRKIGGHPNSLHLTENPKYKTNGCAAVDISTRRWSEEEKEEFIKLITSLGWNYGVASTFIHVDRGQDFGKGFTTWTY